MPSLECSILSLTQPTLIGGHLHSISADVHTAPPTRAFLTRVVKVQDARFTLSDARDVYVRKQICRSRGNDSPEAFGSLEINSLFPHKLRVLLAKYDSSWESHQKAIQLCNKHVRGERSRFKSSNSCSKSFTKCGEISHQPVLFNGYPPAMHHCSLSARSNDPRFAQPSIKCVAIREQLLR